MYTALGCTSIIANMRIAVTFNKSPIETNLECHLVSLANAVGLGILLMGVEMAFHAEISYNSLKSLAIAVIPIMTISILCTKVPYFHSKKDKILLTIAKVRQLTSIFLLTLLFPNSKQNIIPFGLASLSLFLDLVTSPGLFKSFPSAKPV